MNTLVLYHINKELNKLRELQQQLVDHIYIIFNKSKLQMI